MVDITAHDIIDRTKLELAEAEKKVLVTKERLRWLEDIVSETAKVDVDSITNEEPKQQQTLFATQARNEPDTSGGLIRELMLTKKGEFDVKNIASVVAKSYPDVDSSKLTRKASQIACRLAKTNKIKKIGQGIGRKPNTYVTVTHTDK